MLPDFECSWWPDTWFGISLTQCCIDHDLGGSDWDLMLCVSNQHPGFWILGVVMFVGVIFGRPFYKFVKRQQHNHD